MKEIRLSLSWLIVLVLSLVLISLGFAGNVYIDNGVLNLTSDMYVSKAIEGSFKGYIKGSYPIYDSTTSVNITSGNGECNGNYFSIDSVIEHTMTSLAVGEDFHYIYIDDSASIYPTPTIIDSTTEPTWSDSLQGWYNGDDRMIGVVRGNGSSQVGFFTAFDISINLVSYSYGTHVTMASNMNPSGVWLIPDDLDGDLATPVNAKTLKYMIRGKDADSATVNSITNKEVGDIQSNIYLGNLDYQVQQPSSTLEWVGEIPLGKSRKVYIAGGTDDDSELDLNGKGFNYQR